MGKIVSREPGITTPAAITDQRGPWLTQGAKERSWATEFATAAVKVFLPGSAHVISIPSTALVRDGTAVRVYIQHTAERFEFREVKTRRMFGDAVEIVSGPGERDRVVVRGAEKMPRP
jgi:hypothetical protein